MTHEIALANSPDPCLVDDEDSHAVSGHTWYRWRPTAGSTWYVCSHTERPVKRIVLMHRFLFGLQSFEPTVKPGRWPLVDHRNGNGLDNRRSNLRLATQAQNMSNRGRPTNNTSGYKGVSAGRLGGWRAYITSRGKRLDIGTFASKEEAAEAYNAKALELHGEFARLNEISYHPLREHAAYALGARAFEDFKEWDDA